MSLVRTSLLCCALFLAAHAWAPATIAPTVPVDAAPTTASLEPSCRDHGCGCPHERAPEACCCSGETRAPAVAEPHARRPLDPTEIVVARGDERAPAAAFVPFRCGAGPRSSGDAPVSSGSLAEPSSEPAVAPAPPSWPSWPASQPPREPSSEPLTPPPRSAVLASLV